MAVVQLAGELQASVDPHADRSAQQLLGTNGGAELAGALRFVTDLVEAALDPVRRDLQLDPGQFPLERSLDPRVP